MNKLQYEEWKRFDVAKPRSMCGVIIKIVTPDDYDHSHDVKNRVFYGHMHNGSIFLMYDITDPNNPSGMVWKVLKEYDFQHLYWLYDVNLAEDVPWNQHKE